PKMRRATRSPAATSASNRTYSTVAWPDSRLRTAGRDLFTAAPARYRTPTAGRGPRAIRADAPVRYGSRADPDRGPRKRRGRKPLASALVLTLAGVAYAHITGSPRCLPGSRPRGYPSR